MLDCGTNRVGFFLNTMATHFIFVSITRLVKDIKKAGSLRGAVKIQSNLGSHHSAHWCPNVFAKKRLNLLIYTKLSKILTCVDFILNPRF